MPNRPTTPADAYAAFKQREIPSMARALAALWGPPPNSEKLTDAEKVRLWRLQWPGEPLGPEAIERHMQMDPKDRRRHPSVERAAELLQLGFMAEAGTIWQHPYREETYRAGNPDPEDATKEAERIARLVAKGEESNEARTAARETAPAGGRY